MLAPKGFEQTVSAKLFEQGHVTAARKRGILRYTFPMILLGTALILYGLRAIQTAIASGQMLSMWLSGVGILLTGVALIVLWTAVFPNRVKKTAVARYPMHEALYGRTAVTFTQDEMTLTGEKLTVRVAFAKTRLCVETGDLFVIFTDEEAVVLLDKAAFTAPEETTAFLRDVFARWYKKG